MHGSAERPEPETGKASAPASSVVPVQGAEIVAHAERDAVGMHTALDEQIGPPLVFVIGACPDAIPDAILGTAARSPDGPAVMRIAAAEGRKIHGSVANFSLPVNGKPGEGPRIGGATGEGGAAQLGCCTGRVQIQFPPLRMKPELTRRERDVDPVDPQRGT